MESAKSFWKSLTLWGGAILGIEAVPAVPAVSNLLELVGTPDPIASAIVGAIGLFMVVFGRVRAKQSLTPS